ncbi:MAG: hypothetical protein NC215_00445 [Ruminococcus sp.]|nr:hypothetical protein [Ruminococcus sp.]
MDENTNMINDEIIEDTEVITESSDEKGMSIIGIGLAAVGGMITVKLIDKFVKPKVSNLISKVKQKRAASKAKDESAEYDVEVVDVKDGE